MIKIARKEVENYEEYDHNLFWGPQRTLYKICDFSCYDDMPSRIAFLKYISSLENIPGLVLPINLLKDSKIFGYEMPYIDGSLNIDELLYYGFKNIDVKKIIASIFANLSEIHKYFIFNDVRNANILIKGDNAVFIDWDLGIELDSLEKPPTCYYFYEYFTSPQKIDDLAKAFISALCLFYHADFEHIIANYGPYDFKQLLISAKINEEIIHCFSEIILAYKQKRSTIDFDFSGLFESINLPSKREIKRISNRINL